MHGHHGGHGHHSSTKHHGRSGTPGAPGGGGAAAQSSLGTKTYTTRYARGRRSSAGASETHYGDGKVPSSAPSNGGLESTKFLRNSFLATTAGHGYNPMGNRTHGARALERYSRAAAQSASNSKVHSATLRAGAGIGGGAGGAGGRSGVGGMGAGGPPHIGGHGGGLHGGGGHGGGSSGMGVGGGKGGAVEREDHSRGDHGGGGGPHQHQHRASEGSTPARGTAGADSGDGGAMVARPKAFGAEDANPGYRSQMEDA